MNRAEIKAEIERIIMIETDVTARYPLTEAAERILEFLEDVGFDADASAIEAGR